jgi:hypothetical protein
MSTSSSDPTTLPIFVLDEPDDTSGTKSFGLGRGTGEAVLKRVPVDALRESVRELSASLAEVFADVRAVGDFTLQEVRLQVEVSASGGVQLVGTAKAGGKGALTLTFRPPTDE